MTCVDPRRPPLTRPEWGSAPRTAKYSTGSTIGGGLAAFAGVAAGGATRSATMSVAGFEQLQHRQSSSDNAVSGWGRGFSVRSAVRTPRERDHVNRLVRRAESSLSEAPAADVAALSGAVETALAAAPAVTGAEVGMPLVDRLGCAHPGSRSSLASPALLPTVSAAPACGSDSLLVCRSGVPVARKGDRSGSARASGGELGAAYRWLWRRCAPCRRMWASQGSC